MTKILEKHEFVNYLTKPTLSMMKSSQGIDESKIPMATKATPIIIIAVFTGKKRKQTRHYKYDKYVKKCGTRSDYRLALV